MDLANPLTSERKLDAGKFAIIIFIISLNINALLRLYMTSAKSRKVNENRFVFKCTRLENIFKVLLIHIFNKLQIININYESFI